MKLIESTFNNFRCFKQYEIQYGSEITVIIGKNGTGKSSVLSGIRRGMSFMFAKPKNFKKNFSTSNNATVKSFSKLEANFDPIARNYNYPISNLYKAVFNGQQIDWAIVKNNMNGALLTSPYSQVLEYILQYYNNNTDAVLPVLAVITDSFPHIGINTGSKAKKIIGQDIVPRDFGYYGWDERTSCIDIWLNRFYKVSDYEKDLKNDIESLEEQIFLYEKLIENKDEFDKDKIPEWENKIRDLKGNLRYFVSDSRRFKFKSERDYIESKLIEFTKPLEKEYSFINSEFELYRVAVGRVDRKNYSLEFYFKDLRVITFETLPMGYKRIFSIVLDIAYRSYILNEGIENGGIVLIDEIELHLHPTLQQEVLQRLRKTFPTIQFIVTTHSPLVISNFKSNENNRIIKLEQDENNYRNELVENIYGIDYNTGLSEIMGANYRKSEINNIIDSIVILLKYGNKDQAKLLNDELQKLVGKSNKFIEEEIDRRLNQNHQ